MKFIFQILIIVSVLISLTFSQNCHPQCSWKCDDPKCDAVCTPVCEPPKCHSSCQEPKNAVCDVKCEKPNCQIMCPDRACEADDCPKCVTICKPPHCVTHCQAPKPECEAVCEEPKCDWKCHKPQCPKPKCELVCENPNCRPTTECCKCQGNSLAIGLNLPMFKEAERDPKCCNCENKNTIPINAGAASVKINHFEKNDLNSGVNNNDDKLITHEHTHMSVNALPNPVRIAPSYYQKPTDLINRIEAPTQ